MKLQDLIDVIGIENVMNELEKWLSSDDLEMFIEDVRDRYDLDCLDYLK